MVSFAGVDTNFVIFMVIFKCIVLGVNGGLVRWPSSAQHNAIKKANVSSQHNNIKPQHNDIKGSYNAHFPQVDIII